MYGSSCRNSHDTNAALSYEGQSRVSLARTLPIIPKAKAHNQSFPQETKTIETCWYFDHGQCKYESRCRKSHDLGNETTPTPPVQLKTAIFASQVLPHSPSSESWRAKSSPKQKLVPEAPSFTPSSQLNIPESSTSKTQLTAHCIYFANGYCRNGQKCLYQHSLSHDLPKLPPSPSQRDEKVRYLASLVLTPRIVILMIVG